MKFPVKSNMYEKTLVHIWEHFASYLSGCREGAICIVSSRRLNAQAKNAFNSSFARLGYGKGACTFISLEPNSAEEASSNGGATPTALSNVRLFTLIEGLDPLFLVITDEQSARVCELSYRQTIPLHRACRVFGRETRAFSSFENMLKSDEEKQRAWRLLKTFPRFSS